MTAAVTTTHQTRDDRSAGAETDACASTSFGVVSAPGFRDESVAAAEDDDTDDDDDNNNEEEEEEEEEEADCEISRSR